MWRASLRCLTDDPMRGTIRKLGLEGGLWALITDDGKTVELIDPPSGLRQDGMKVEVEADAQAKPDVSIGMVGDAVTVKDWKKI